MATANRKIGLICAALALALCAVYFSAEPAPVATRASQHAPPPAPVAHAYFETVPAAHPAPPVPPALVRSFDAERDLHQFYLAAKQSNDPAVVYQAYRAYIQCQALVSNANNVRVAFAGGDHARIEGDMMIRTRSSARV